MSAPQFALTLVQPLANLWGIPADAMLSLFTIFVIIAITGLIVFTTGRKGIGIFVFMLALFISSLMGLVNWVVFVLVLVLMVSVYAKINTGGS